MIGKTMEDTINKQINEEMYSAYLYLSMSAYFESVNLNRIGKKRRLKNKK